MLSNIKAKWTDYNKGPHAPDVVTAVELGSVYNPHGCENIYVVYITFNLGEGGGYQYEEVAFDADDKEDLVAFLNFLNLCAVRYINLRGHEDNYSDVEGYSRWVEGVTIEDEDELTEEELEEARADQVLEWPFWEDDYAAAFVSAQVIFFDENGGQRTVLLATQ